MIHSLRIRNYPVMSTNASGHVFSHRPFDWPTHCVIPAMRTRTPNDTGPSKWFDLNDREEFDVHLSSISAPISRLGLFPQHVDQKYVHQLKGLATRLLVFFLAPYNSILLCTQTAAKFYSKIVDYFHGELRSAFELTHLFENYALTLSGRSNDDDRTVRIELI